MHRTLFLAILTFTILTPHITHGADPKFRRPINNTPTISAYYDNDTSSAKKTYACGSTTYNGHTGTDFATPLGTPVYASTYGGMYYTYNGCPTTGYYGSTCGGGYGNHARVDHELPDYGDGLGWMTIYAHLMKDTLVRPQFVDCGEYIGQSGSSGNSTGPHLHFEVRKYGPGQNDPFAGNCSHPTSFWINQSNGIPTSSCTN
jgi:murein DD-endopeptidase MepM/ murein hydrolase activator NlpD